MAVELRPFRPEDAEAHHAGEDALTVRWLTGRPGSVDLARRHAERLEQAAASGSGLRGYGVWLDGRLAGYVDHDPDVRDGLEDGEVNLTYATHAWARGRGVAPAAVGLLVQRMREQGVGRRAAIRLDPGNLASARVAEKAGFAPARDVVSGTDTHADGTPALLRVYLRDL